MTLRNSSMTLIALIWPLVAVLLATASPGPGSAPVGPLNEQRRLRVANPPSDERGSTVYLDGAQSSGQARVFWEEPGKVQFKMVVEIPPEKAATDKPDATTDQPPQADASTD